MSTGLTARVAYKYDKRTTMHSSARVSVVGGASQVELGARYRWGRLTSTGLAVAYGTQVRPCALPPGLPSAFPLHCYHVLCPLSCPALNPAFCSALPVAMSFAFCPALPCSALPDGVTQVPDAALHLVLVRKGCAATTIQTPFCCKSIIMSYCKKQLLQRIVSRKT